MHVKKSRIPMTRLLSLLLCTAMFGSVFAPAVMAEDGEPIVVEEAEARYYGEAELLPAPEPAEEEPAPESDEAEALFAELMALDNANDLFNALQALNEEQRALLGEQRLYALEQRLYALQLAENSAMFPAPPEETEEEESEDSQNEEEIEEEAEPLFYMELTAHTGEEDPDDRIVVTVRGEFSEGAYVTVSEIPEEETGLEEIVAEDEEYMALDISLRRADGTEMEPNATVMVDISLGKNRIPETLPVAEEITLVHMEENEEEITAVEMAGLQMDVSEENVDASFVTASFSTFVIKWKTSGYGGTTYQNVQIHYVNTMGQELDDDLIVHSDETYTSGSSDKTYTFANYAPATISDLVFVEARTGDNGFSTAQKCTSMTFNYRTTGFGLGTKYYHDLDIYNGNEKIKTYSASGSTTHHVYLVYKTQTTTPPIEEEIQMAHDKYVVEKDDGSYDLTLTISGAVSSRSTKTKLDILMIVDYSGSMSQGMNSNKDVSSPNRRIDKVVAAANSLMSIIDANDAIDPRYNLVKFSSFGYNRNGEITGWTDKSSVIADAMNKSPSGGTNYQYGIYLGKQQLNVKSRDNMDDVKKVVIFLTDGLPTFRGTSSKSEDGNGSSDGYGYNQAAAIEEIKTLNSDMFYVIGVGPEMDNKNDTGYKNLTALKNTAKATSKGVYSTTSDSELENIFKQIAAEAQMFLCSDVEVDDTMSDMVDVVYSNTGKPKSVSFSVYEKDSSGKKIGSNKATYKSGTEYQYTIAKGSQNESNGTATITFNKATEALELTFNNGYKLEPNWEYAITINIEPNDPAYSYYQKNGYPVILEDGSQGFYSNVNELATVTYSYLGKTETKPYPKPIIEVRTGTVVVSKTVTAESEEALEELITALQEDLTLTVTGSAKVGTIVIPFKELVNGEDGLNEAGTFYREFDRSDVETAADGSASQTFSVIFPRMRTGSYSVAESKYTVDYYERKDGDKNISASGTVTWDKTSRSGSTATLPLTNSYTHNVGELKITKTVTAENSARLGAVLDALSTGGFTLSYVNDNDSTITDSYAVKRSDWTVSGSTATYTWEVGEVLIGSYTASESNAAADGFTLTKNPTSGSVKGGVTKKQTTELELANDYKIKFGTIQVTKNLTQKSETPQKDMNYIFQITGTTVAGESVVYYIPVQVPAGNRTAGNSIDYAIYGNYTCTELTPAVGSLSGSISCNSNTGTLSDSNNPLTFTATNTFDNHVDFDTVVANNRFSYESSSWSWSRVLG